MEILDATRKLIGRIQPVGETYEDEERYVNLEQHEIVVMGLVEDLINVSEAKDRTEYSMKRSGECAYKILGEIKRWIDDYVM